MNLRQKIRLTMQIVPTAQPWLFAKGCLIEVGCACEVVYNSGCVRWRSGVYIPTSLFGQVAFGRRHICGVSGYVGKPKL